VAAYEVLLLNTAIPQIQAAQSGDTYVVPRDIAINATAIISANSATDALRITQTGAGNALLVEDSTNPDSSPFVVTAAGDVGIGTTNPLYKLHVNGNIYASAIEIGEASAFLSNSPDALIGWASSFSGYTNGTLILQSRSSAGTPIVFATGSPSATERMRLDSSGNLGLGVTPSALWDSAFRAIQVGSLTSLAYNNGFGQTHLLNNAIYTTSWVYQTSGVAAVRYDQRNGEHQWFRSTSAQVAGTDPVFSQAMTLDASGNLGIGITNPAVRLAVNGAARVGANVVGQYVEFSHDTANGLLSTNTGALGYSAPSYHYWSIGGTERARITSAGQLLVGTNSAIGSERFLVRLAAADYVGRLENDSTTAANCFGLFLRYGSAAPNGTGNLFLRCDDSAATRAEIRSNGGLANYQSNNVDLSDIRTKTDISPLASYWNKIAALEIVTYKYKDQTHDDLNIGVIAQQVEQVAPEFVDADGFGETPEDGVPLKTIYNKDLTFAAIKALQEAMARIEQLEAKVAALEAK
jgi:hypothetical protein